MLLLFIIIIFFLLHIQFLIRNLAFGVEEVQFFDFVLTYPYDALVARSTLLFSLSCTFSFALGYLLLKKIGAPKFLLSPATTHIPSRALLRFTNFFSLIPIGYMISLCIITGFDYGSMVSIRETSTFIFELRVIFLLLLSNIFLNSGVINFFVSHYLRHTRRLLYVYIVATFLFQARSATFEVLAIVLFAHIAWERDRIRIRYLITIAVSMLIPNVIVMGRLGIPDEPGKIISALFSFEYSVLINRFLSAAIEQGTQLSVYSFAPTMQLIVPSPIRDLLGWSVEKSDYYDDLSGLANITSGGFSLLAEMYSNFGWASSVVFLAAGATMGYVNSKAMRVGRVSITTSVAPLLYASFILAFRNDLGVFLKYTIQLVIISWVLYFLIPIQRKKAKCQ